MDLSWSDQYNYWRRDLYNPHWYAVNVEHCNYILLCCVGTPLHEKIKEFKKKCLEVSKTGKDIRTEKLFNEIMSLWRPLESEFEDFIVEMKKNNKLIILQSAEILKKRMADYQMHYAT